MLNMRHYSTNVVKIQYPFPYVSEAVNKDKLKASEYPKLNYIWLLVRLGVEP